MSDRGRELKPSYAELEKEIERLQNEIHNKWEPLTGYERAAAFEEAAKVAENAIFMSYSPIAAAIRKHAKETTT